MNVNCYHKRSQSAITTRRWPIIAWAVAGRLVLRTSHPTQDLVNLTGCSLCSMGGYGRVHHKDLLFRLELLAGG